MVERGVESPGGIAERSDLIRAPENDVLLNAALQAVTGLAQLLQFRRYGHQRN